MIALTSDSTHRRRDRLDTRQASDEAAVLEVIARMSAHHQAGRHDMVGCCITILEGVTRQMIRDRATRDAILHTGVTR